MSTQPPDLRVSDQDRERAASALSVHFAQGRLDEADLDQRLKAVYEARTESQLAGPLADLPALAESQLEARAEFAERRRTLERRLLQQAGGGLVPFVACTLIWAASGAGSFWPVWLLLIFVVPLVRNGWALYGPDPDLDAVEADLDRRAAQARSGSEGRAGQRRARAAARTADRHARAAERRYGRRPPTA